MRSCLIILIFAAACFGSTARAENDFLAGADFSDLEFFESRGVTYKDGAQATDGLQILRNHGFNCVRLRLWTSSSNQAAANPYNYGNNLAYTLPLAVRVKKAGLLFALDFHYSDTWADPGKQFTPASWTNLDFTQLVGEMRRYNSNTVATFAKAGAMPDFVQVGNEITGGMLWPKGRVSGDGGASWTNLALLMKAATRGIQEGATAARAKMPKIIVHIDRGADWNTTKWFFDNLDVQKVPYDIIGESYYPFFHGPLTNLSICLSNAAVRYHKPVIVAETAFPWTNLVTRWTNKLYGFDPTVSGQVAFVSAVRKVVDSVPDHLGAGILYWGAEYQPMRAGNGGGFSTASLFDFQGNVLPAADVLSRSKDDR
jgi:arabinogalactan endo-1,4-beta-galactosidase